MMNNTPYRAAADRLQAVFGDAPGVAIVLGSGMGPVSARVDPVEAEVAYPEVGLPPTGVAGHGGTIRVGLMGGRRVAVLSGRVHLYEGRPAEEVVRAMRALATWGVERVVLTSAVGGISPELHPGMLVRISDHLNFQGVNVLRGPNDDSLGPRFPDMTHTYDPEMSADLDAVARAQGAPLPLAVYAATPGPSYETPAEVRMYGLLGAQVVGMSLAAEATGAAHAGLRILAVSTISNYAAGLTNETLQHEDVTRVVGQAADRLGDLLQALVARW